MMIIKHVLSLLFLILAQLLNITDAKTNVSGLCDSGSPLQNMSCSRQLWGSAAPSNDCIMWLPNNPRRHVPARNSVECDNIDLGVQGLKTSPDLVKVKLQAYAFQVNKMTYTAFNATFSGIKWQELKMRYKQNKVNRSNFCREFTLDSGKSVPATSHLFYDCLWATQDAEGKTFIFEYQARNGPYVTVGNFLFNVPNSSYINSDNKDLKKSELFMYIDTSSLPVLKLRVQTAQDRYNVSSEDYLVEVHYESNSGKKTVTPLQVMNIEDDELTFEYNTASRSGSYTFWARLKTLTNDAFASMSPTYKLQGDSPTIILIAIVGCGGAILSVVSFAFFLWRRRVAAMRKQPPTVLMIYAATTAKHRAAVIELAKFLNTYCRVNALVDDLDIPKSKTKDPFMWCNSAFKQSKFVMILSSPFHQCNNYEGIYVKVDALGLWLVANSMGDRTSDKRFFSVLMPYCTERDIPAEAQNMRQFSLTRDLDTMLGYIHSETTSPCGRCCIEPLIYGGKHETILRTDGRVLSKAIEAAEFELVGRSSACNCKRPGHLLLNELRVEQITEEVAEEQNLLRDGNNDLIEIPPMNGPNLGELNLLGDLGQEAVVVASRPVVNSGLDINTLQL